jgi:hypothetical protein
VLVSLDACQRAYRRLDDRIPQGEPLSARVRRALTVTPFAPRDIVFANRITWPPRRRLTTRPCEAHHEELSAEFD